MAAISSSSLPLSSNTYKFHPYYSYPPFWTLQPTIQTREAQFKIWSSIILTYCRHHHLWRLTLVEALNTPLFRNLKLQKWLTLLEAREILDWMTRDEGARRAEWRGREGEKGSCWIYWRRPEEWADTLSTWVRYGLASLKHSVAYFLGLDRRNWTKDYCAYTIRAYRGRDQHVAG